jgi:hypothetical protein
MNEEQLKIASKKIRSMVVMRYPDVRPDDLESSEPFKLREVQYHSSGSIISNIEYDQDGNVAEEYRNTLNEKGEVVEHIVLLDGEVIERIELKYNAAGKIVEETRMYEEGDPSPTIYTYDNNNELLERRVESSPGEVEQGDRYEYHPEFTTKVTRHEEYMADGEVVRVVTHEYENVGGEGAVLVKSFSENKETGKSYRTEHFDAKKHEDNVAAVIYDSDNRVSNIIYEFFDDAFRLIRTEEKSRNPGADPSIEYGYDEKGNMNKQVQYVGGRLHSQWEKQFGENGLEEWIYGQSGSGMSYTDVYTYEFFE